MSVKDPLFHFNRLSLDAFLYSPKNSTPQETTRKPNDTQTKQKKSFLMHDRVTRQTEKRQNKARTELTAIHAIRQQATLAAHTNKEYQYITDFRAVRTVLN